jgi:hypothetical protein
MIRNFIERKAFEILMSYWYPKAVIVGGLVNKGHPSVEIAAEVGGNKVILGVLSLLAANHMKKNGIWPVKPPSNKDDSLHTYFDS